MVTEISFEDGIKRIEEILDLLENKNAGLKDTMALYEEGIKLLNKCSVMLDTAEQKVEILKSSFNEPPVTEAFAGDGNEAE